MENVINYFTELMIENKVIDQKQGAVIRYGLDLLFSSIVSILSLLLLGLIKGRFGETLLLLLIFIPLQSFGGGYHCKTHFRCWLLMVIGCLCAMTFLVNFPMELLRTGALLCSYIFTKYAPIENAKAPFGNGFRQKMRKVTMLLYLIALMIAFLMNLVKMECAKIVYVAIVLVGISIIGARIRKINSGI